MNTSSARHTLAKGISLSLILAVLFAGAYFLFLRGTKDVAVEAANDGYDLLKRAGKDLYHALQFQPKVVVGERTVLGPAKEVTEAVTASKTFDHTYIYEVSWAGSTKRLELKGDFTAKAGFPIDDSFSLNISEDGKTVTMRHSLPKLISCEMTKIHVLKDEDEYWNKIQPSEREAAQNTLIQQARRVAETSDLMATAAQNLVERLAPLQQQHSFVAKNEVLP